MVGTLDEIDILIILYVQVHANKQDLHVTATSNAADIYCYKRECYSIKNSSNSDKIFQRYYISN